MMRFEEKIVELRKQKGLSQEELAEQLRVSRQAVSRWELGQTLPDIPNLLQLWELFGVGADYLVKDEREDAQSGNESSETMAAEATLEAAKQKEKQLACLNKERAKRQNAARSFYNAGWIMAIACISFSVASLIKSDKVEVTVCILQCVVALVYFCFYAWNVKKMEKLDLEREELE